MVSVNETIVMPTAPTARATASDALVHGSCGVGNPLGNVPTVDTPWAARSNSADATVTPTTATSTAGIFLVNRGRTSSTISTHSPVRSVTALRPLRPSTNPRTSSTKPSASTEKPNSLGSWPTMIVIARPLR